MLKLTKESLVENAKKYAHQFIDGLNKSVTPFHAVEYLKNELVQQGFKEINEK